ncbi:MULTISPECIES: outer membrane protein transport protein [unclassified Dyella]|uniref:OmpP1/FadL family transporter n=1 Tax=unclassified Dyella TaxID=2634549 RepID=UPI000C81498B|nr:MULTISPECIES: outer membrane protein transport protein [unclassified Dyella]MDR3447112.1 outer membrane protein transport protein [Dyella sp.]PMQ04830.1 putative outer membrane protein [Dyella sp. AD56]
MQMSFRQLSRAGRPLTLAALSLAILGSLAAPQRAHASAFQLHEDSAAAMGRAYAGSATAGGDASVVANNPAAMSDLKGTYFQADVTAINFGTSFSGTAHDALGRPINGNGGGDAGTTMPVPAFFFATQLGDKWHVGAAFTVPFGFQTEYDNNWIGRYNAIKSKFESLDGTLSVSYDVSDNFAIGVSGIAQKTSAELTSAINYNAVGLGLVNQAVQGGAIPPATGAALAQQVNTIVPPGSDGIARIKGDDWAYGYQIGMLWKITPNDKFALDYRSKISHRLEGTANFTVPSNVQALLSNPTVAALLAGAGGTPFTHTEGTAPFTTPAVATASYWHQEEKFGLGADVAWTKWDSFKDLNVYYANPAQPTTSEAFNWKNSWYIAIGGEYYANDKLTLRAGLALDTTPTQTSTRDPRVPDGTRQLVSFGAGYKINEKFVINASYAHIFVNSARINAASSTGDVITGSSDDYGNLLSLSAQYKF